MEGLKLLYKDYTENQSFENFQEFNEHIQSCGKRATRGSVRCSMCLRKFQIDGDRLPHDAVNFGTMVYHCLECKKELVKEIQEDGND